MKLLQKIPHSILGFLKYAVVGSLGTAIDVIFVFIFAVKLGYPLYISTSIAFVLAATNNFILNKIWTFGEIQGKYKRQYIKFLIVSILGLGLTLLCMVVLVEVFHFPIILSKLFTSGVVLSWNFLANKYWTFSAQLNLSFTPSQKKYPLFLSIIIPAYNESHRIGNTLELLDTWVKQHPQAGGIEIILVNDGSSDATSEIVRGAYPDVHIVDLDKNRGKGWAVAQGVFSARGRYSLIYDADSSTPIREIEKFFPYIGKFDMLIGSRYKGTSQMSKKQNLFRRLVSRAGNRLIQWILIDDIEDTQCGFKLFETDKGCAIFSKQKIYRWGFDIEMLFLARAFGFSLLEIGIVWDNNTDSRFRAIRDSGRTFYELLCIKFFAWFGGYN